MVRQALFALSAICCCNLSIAGSTHWKKIAATDESTIYTEFSRASLHIEESAVHILVLEDYKGPRRAASGKSYLSRSANYVFDCRTAAVTLQNEQLYPQGMGNGTAISSPLRERRTVSTDELFSLVCTGMQPSRNISKWLDQNDALSTSTPSPNKEGGKSSPSADNEVVVSDQCKDWGLRHGTAEYVDCQIKLLQMRGNSPEPARATRSQQAIVDSPVRSELQRERDVDECRTWADAQPNPYTEKVREYKGYVYGSPKSYSYQGQTIGGRTYSGTVTENPDFSQPSGALAGIELGRLRVLEENHARQIAIRCMQDKGYKLK
jgi:hypothetical protein